MTAVGYAVSLRYQVSCRLAVLANKVTVPIHFEGGAGYYVHGHGLILEGLWQCKGQSAQPADRLRHLHHVETSFTEAASGPGRAIEVASAPFRVISLHHANSHDASGRAGRLCCIGTLQDLNIAADEQRNKQQNNSILFRHGVTITQSNVS